MQYLKTSRITLFLIVNVLTFLSLGLRAPGDWVTLFDGKRVEGWHSYNQNQAVGWFVENGTLTTDGTGGDLVTDKEYGDFQLEFEFKIPKGSNSGVLYKVLERQDIKRTVFSAPEYQIIDDNNYVVKDSTGKNIGLKPVQLSGANYDMNPPLDTTAFKPAGSWNTGKIIVEKDHVRHLLNGKLVADYHYGDQGWKEKVAKSKFRDWPYATPHHRGKIALQNHNAREKVWFRNIRILEMNL